MNAMEWHAYLETHGMGEIHKASRRIPCESKTNLIHDDDLQPPKQARQSPITEADREYIRTHYPTRTAKDIAAVRGLNQMSVTTIAKRMGVEKVKRAPEARLAAIAAAHKAYNAKRKVAKAEADRGRSRPATSRTRAPFAEGT